MAWTVTLLEIVPDSQRPIAKVLFTDNVKHKRVEPIELSGLTATAFKARVESMRAGFEAQFSFIDSVDAATFDLTPDTPKQPTPEEAKRTKYFIDRGRLEVLIRDVALGIIAPDAQELKTQLALVISEREDGF